MNRRLTVLAVTLSVLSLLQLVLTNVWARQNTVFDQLDLLVDIRHELVSAYVEAPDETEMVEAAVRGMVESLNDPYTTYFNDEEFSIFEHNVRGSFSGIGAEVDLHENRLRIVTPLEDSPAWKAGVMAGDIVLEIDGESTLNMKLTDAVKRLTGEAGTQVNLHIRHESGEEAHIAITRDVIKVQTVRGFRRDADQHFDFIIDDQHNVGYVRLTQFTENTADELRDALTQIKNQNAKGLIIDVRFNPGGLLESAVEISDMFLGEGQTIVSVQGRVVPKQVFSATDDTLLPDMPVVIVANEASASAAEILTGALKDNARAQFIGSRTFGKGSVQQVRQLDAGHGALKLTNAYYYIPSGRLIHRRDDSEVWGVDPSADAYVPMSPQQVRDMVKLRRENDLVRQGNGQDHTLITPQYIEDHLKDPQLAAAVRAMVGKITTGNWPVVGQSNADELVKANKRANLVLRRDLLQQSLDEVQQQLEAFDAGDITAGDELSDASAKQAEDADAAPTDAQKVQQQVQQTTEIVPAEDATDEEQEVPAAEMELQGQP